MRENLRDPDTLFTGILIFGEKVCPCCGTPLPANTDYFSYDLAAHGLMSECRLCRSGKLNERRLAARRWDSLVRDYAKGKRVQVPARWVSE